VRRVVGIELRRSGALWTAATLLAGGTWLLYDHRERWNTGYLLLALDQRWYLPLLAGIAMAAGAAQGRREHRCRVGELFAGVPRPRLQQAGPMLIVYGLPIAAAYAGTTALAALRILGTAHYLRPAAFAGVVAVGAATMVAAAWSGLAVGRHLPYVVTAPALAIASLAFPAAAAGITGHREWLSRLLFPAYGLGGPGDFVTVPVRFSVAQLLWLAGLAGGAALLFAAGRRRAWLLAPLPPVLGAGAAILLLHGGAAVAPDPIDTAARELVCTADAPRVCVARLHRGLLGEATPPARAALARLSRLPHAPNRAEEMPDSTGPLAGQPADTLLIPIGVGDDGHLLDRDRLEGHLIDNVGVVRFRCPDDRPGTDPAVVAAATAWLRGAEPDLTGDGAARARELWRTLTGLDEREAAARVGAVRQAVLACATGDDLLTRPA
jgi:hypothetical protein